MPGTRTERFFRHGTLPQMRVFEAVARLGSFTRAGEETHMAQPTVSVHMKKLAETVGVPLLRVSGKRVQLTPAGEALYATVRSVMQSFKELDQTLAGLYETKSQTLRIATTSAGEFLLPPLLAQFVKLHPDVEVSMYVSARPNVLERLARNEDDLYLLADPSGGTYIDAEPLLRNPLAHWHVIRSPAGLLSPVAQAFVDFATTEVARIFAERESGRVPQALAQTSGL